MINFTKQDAREEIPVAGRTITLVRRTWVVSFKTPWFGLGASYQRPHSLEDGQPRKIHDHLMLARAGAAALLALAILMSKAGE